LRRGRDLTQQRLWLAFAIVAGVGFGIQVSMPVDQTDRPETTFDTAPRGHAGVFALLERFDGTPGRWLSGLTMPAVDETIWWIAPTGACEDVDESDSVDAEDADSPKLRSPFEVIVRPWIEAGGTALVWLSPPPPPLRRPGIPVEVSESSEASTETDGQDLRADWEESLAEAREDIREGMSIHCHGIAGFAIPPRQLAGLEGGALPADRHPSPIVFSVGRAVVDREDFDYDTTRILPGPTLAFFSDGDDSVEAMEGWRSLWVEADDLTPLALERSVGKGRLVVVADARILSNARLAHVDSAPFVFGWVEQYGRPWIDEHLHGVVPEAGTFRYLASSPARAAGLGLLLIGVLVVWRGHAWPTRAVSEYDPDAPTLAAFVDSVERLYSGTRDHGRVFERYRAVCLDRIRRALGLAPGSGVEIILTSLRTRASNWPQLRDSGLRHLLTKRLPISSAEDLARNAARLDDLVRVLRGREGAGEPRPPLQGASVGQTKGNQ
jgi:hypothetical protein